MSGQLEDKIALITGGGSGIGKATALAFAREGAKVIVADKDIEKGTATAAMINDINGEAIFVEADVSRTADVESMIDAVINSYGRLDCAFNNAGIADPVGSSAAELSEEAWNKVIGINLTGVWLCVKYEIQQMLKQGKGAIVNTASVAGLVGFQGLPAYVASKHGVIGLTQTAALEYAKLGIRVNAVCPGVIKTSMVDRITGKVKEVEKQFENMEPIGRMGQPEEVAAVATWLCSDNASFVTGNAMTIDGGWTAQ